MRVEVDTADITALEQRVELLTGWLTALVRQTKTRKVSITAASLEAGGGVTVIPGDGRIELVYVPDGAA